MKLFVSYDGHIDAKILAEKYEFDYFFLVPDHVSAGVIAGKIPIHRIAFETTHLWEENEWVVFALDTASRITCLPSPQIHGDEINFESKLHIDKMHIPWDRAFEHEATSDELEHILAECIKYADDHRIGAVKLAQSYDYQERKVKFTMSNDDTFSLALLKNCERGRQWLQYNYAQALGRKYSFV